METAPRNELRADLARAHTRYPGPGQAIMRDAYVLGWRARKAGDRLPGPFEIGSASRTAWREGWHAADAHESWIKGE